MVDPDDSDEKVADHLTDGSGPKRPKIRECRFIRSFEFEHVMVTMTANTASENAIRRSAAGLCSCVGLWL